MQEAIKRAGEANTEEAKRGAEEARKQAANALKDAGLANEAAGKANDSAAKANERAEKLEGANIQLRTDLENATAESRAKQAELAREQTKLATEQRKTAEAQREAAVAQLALKKHLEEVAESTRHRHLTTKQRATLLGALKASPHKGTVEIGCPISNSEACAFAEEFRDVLRDAGWTVTGFGLLPLPGQVVGVILEMKDAHKAPIRAVALAEALQSAGIEGPLTLVPIPSAEVDFLSLVIGAKP